MPLPIAVGDEVLADDGIVGSVEEVMWSESHAPRFIVVTVRRRIGRRHPVIPAELVSAVDRRASRIHLRGTRDRIVRLPETVPLLL